MYTKIENYNLGQANQIESETVTPGVINDMLDNIDSAYGGSSFIRRENVSKTYTEVLLVTEKNN